MIISKYLQESKDKSSIQSDYVNDEYIDINKFRKIDCKDKSYLKHFFKYDPVIKRIVDFTSKEPSNNGFIFIDVDEDKLVGYVIVTKAKYIAPIYVYPEFRGHNLSNQLMDIAIHELGANKLRCYKDNRIAIKLYLSKGFKITREQGTGAEAWYEMKYHI